MAKRIALALSGGGSRAIAFHLGCLRAIHENGLLEDVRTVSSVSGGSVIAAAYLKYGGNFEDFEKRIIELLKSGLLKPTLRTALSHWGVLWLLTELYVLTVTVVVGTLAVIPRTIRWIV